MTIYFLPLGVKIAFMLARVLVPVRAFDIFDIVTNSQTFSHKKLNESV